MTVRHGENNVSTHLFGIKPNEPQNHSRCRTLREAVAVAESLVLFDLHVHVQDIGHRPIVTAASVMMLLVKWPLSNYYICNCHEYYVSWSLNQYMHKRGSLKLTGLKTDLKTFVDGFKFLCLQDCLYDCV